MAAPTMIHIPLWKKIAVIVVCVLAFVYSAPNLLDQGVRERLATQWPSWMPVKAVNLGLDLRGGSHLLLEVGVDKVLDEREEALVQSLRPQLRQERIGYTRINTIPQGVRVTLRDESDAARVRSMLRQIDGDLDILTNGAVVEGKLSEASIRRIRDQTLGQSIEIVRRRVDETGTREPMIARQGDDRIVVQIPGLDDPQRIKDLLGKTAKLSFHMVVDGTADLREAGGTLNLPMSEFPGQTTSVMRRPILTGDMLTGAQPSFNQQGMPVVSFSLNGIGARRFCEVTSKSENIGRPFAIVLDDMIISAPAIREPICGGVAQISGSFTVQETSDLALLLRAGALPAPLSVLEERTVGPSLGADSVEAGKIACMVGLLFVVLCCSLVYGLFGVFASIALVINVALIMAIMSMLQATLTLPGIAGIVLTMGMAVDANVLIFERMKEEIRGGRSVMSAMDAGYNRAMTTIIDSNLTTLIAAIILFSFGSGPIKGFAVTMCIGIITSYFSAIMVTRLMVTTWLRWKKPSTIAV